MFKDFVWFSLNPDKGLEKQGLFWFSICIPVLLSIFLWIPLWNVYSFSFTKDGYDTFLLISRLPLAMCSLSIPFSVIVARIHGTKQTAKQLANTKKQIDNTEQDNKTKLYLSHYAHFCDYAEGVEKAHYKYVEGFLRNENYNLITRIKLYHALYPQASFTKGFGVFSSEHLKNFEQFLEEYLEKIKEILKIEENNNAVVNKRELQGEIVIELTKKIRDYEKYYTFDSTKSSIFKQSYSYLRVQDLVFENFLTYLYLAVYFAHLTIDFLIFETSDNTQENPHKLQVLINKFKLLVNDVFFKKYCAAHSKYLDLAIKQREEEYEAQQQEDAYADKYCDEDS